MEITITNKNGDTATWQIAHFEIVAERQVLTYWESNEWGEIKDGVILDMDDIARISIDVI